MGCDFSSPIPTTTNMMNDVGTGLATKFHRTLSEGDLDACATMAANDVEVVMGDGTSYSGKEGFMKFMRTFHDAFPDISIVHLRDVVQADESVVACECSWTGTHRGNLTLGSGTSIAPTGKTVSSRFIEIYEFSSGGLVKSLSHYQDMTSLLSQLGVQVSSRGREEETSVTPHSLKLGEDMPNFEVETTFGKFKLHDYFGNSWGLLFSHPAGE